MGKQVVVLRTFTHHVHVPVELLGTATIREPNPIGFREDGTPIHENVIRNHRFETRDDVGVEFAMWFPVKPGLEQPVPGAVSRWPGASADESQAIAEGRIVEAVEDATFPADWTAEACLDWIVENRWKPRAAALDARVAPPEWANAVREA